MIYIKYRTTQGHSIKNKINKDNIYNTIVLSGLVLKVTLICSAIVIQYILIVCKNEILLIYEFDITDLKFLRNEFIQKNCLFYICSFRVYSLQCLF